MKNESAKDINKKIYTQMAFGNRIKYFKVIYMFLFI